ncbi:Na+/H+ antiporter NhaC family protein [Virgibacillus sp. LDC-1]|uniref:Na+/H+ antiporter NhaC family protein n=1 Tax=Virgibacillus sp. LDC-1 TaxID=3039856 RepID=UPI0024DED7F4|nr:Na+/H+ antiporter NhaC family protein [Virgibacillus sp. LDC-1]
MENTIWSLVPPLLAILMVLITKRVLVSLGVGIVAAAFFVGSFQLQESLRLIWDAFKGVFVVDGALNTWNIYILLFVLMLGIITAFVSMMGGAQAFGEWMIRRVKTRAGAQIMTMILGVIVFVDDYFNSLTVGQVAKPVTDKHRISRAKLAYIVDSTSAPICVVAPVSSWGAYIIGIIGTVFAAQSISDSEFTAFLQMIPMNFYVWSALGVVTIIALRQVDFGPMKVHEKRAIETGEVLDPNHKETIDSEAKLVTSQIGKITDLVVPIAVLFLATIGFIYWSGYRALTGEEKTLIAIFGEADVSEALFLGGAIGLLVTLSLFVRHLVQKQLTGKEFKNGFAFGAKSMLPGFSILIFAWAIVALIDQLGTGVYLGEVVKDSNLSFALLPFIVFLMAGFIAFSTGTSWGAFALLLPIGGQIAAATDISLILPVMAAVLAGSVFGDHCSPISDTTILSSTGSSCHHIDHVTTQLPYALVAAGIAGFGYLALGLSGSVLLGLAMVFVGLAIFFALCKKPRVMVEEEKIAK